MNRLLGLTLIVALWTATMSNAQSLTDVARAEQARRKTAPKSDKVYTNADLKPDLSPRPTTPSSPSSSRVPSITVPLPPESAPTKQGAAPGSAAIDEGAEKIPQDEVGWRARITAAREQLQRSELFAEALQSRIKRPHHRLRHS